MAAQKREVVPAPSAPADVARHLIEKRYTGRDGQRILRWRGDVYIRERGVWVPRDVDEVRSGLYKWLSACVYRKDDRLIPWRPNTTRINQVIDALGSLTFLDERASPPCRLKAGYPASSLIPLRNCLVDPETRERHEHSRDHFNITVAPYRYDEKAKAAEWKRFLATLWPDDPDSIACLQEMFGYLVSGKTDMEKLFLLVGPMRSGRGTIMTVARALIGREYVVGPTLDSLGRPFGLQPLIGKTLAIVGDARVDGPTTRTATEVLLGISGRDPVSIDRKYKQSWNGILPVRFVILSNEVPHLSDSSGTIETRFEIMKLSRSWLGQEDPSLKNKFTQPKYLPGIFNWALDGHDRLYQQGHFTKPASATGDRQTMLNLSTPYPSFVEEKCVLGPELTVDKDKLYWAWKNWCENNGHKPGSKQWFSRGLFAAFPDVHSAREATGDRTWLYEGIGLRQESVVGHMRPSV